MKDGGSAFPVMDKFNAATADGMTLRDYFAAMAMQALLVNITAFQLSPRLAASNAYNAADAMIAEREKGEGE